MYISEEYKKIVESAYMKARELGKTKIAVTTEILGELMLFIEKKPTFILNTFVMDDGVEVYVGGNSTETVS